MKSFVVDEKMQGRKLVRAVSMAFEKVPVAAVQRALRQRDIRVNGARTSLDRAVEEGDRIDVYLADEILEGKAVLSETPQTQDEKRPAPYRVVYRDSRLLLVEKRQGLAVHPGEGIPGGTLIDLVRRDFKNPGISLCHRLDLNTGGLILLACDAAALSESLEAMEGHKVVKHYRALVKGVVDPSLGQTVVCDDGVKRVELHAFLEKPSGRGVYVHDVPGEDDRDIVTRFRTLRLFKGAESEGGEWSEIEVELVTGRTHQIRAHFAHLGHPLLGDGKYGRNSYNKLFKAKSGKLVRQQLWATSLAFSDDVQGIALAPVRGKVFTVEPDYDLTLPSRGASTDAG